MSNFQYAIDNSTAIQVNYQDITNGAISRNGNITQGTVFGTRPYTIECNMPPVLDGGDANVRGLLSYIDNNARVTTETVNIGATNTGLSYILKYQGTASTTALEALELSSYGNGRPGIAITGQGTTLTPSMLVITLVCNANDIDTGAIYFKKGDFLQLNGPNERPYQVTQQVDSTDFYGGIGTKYLDVPINRVYSMVGGNSPGALSSPEVRIGANVTFQVRCINKPRSSFQPGGPNNLTVRIEDAFELAEVI
jgi:hypothetical protein